MKLGKVFSQTRIKNKHWGVVNHRGLKKLLFFLFVYIYNVDFTRSMFYKGFYRYVGLRRIEPQTWPHADYSHSKNSFCIATLPFLQIFKYIKKKCMSSDNWGY